MAAADRGSRDGIRCMLMRGGTSKGAYFLADDLPADAAGATTCCCGSWAAPTRARSTGSAAPTRSRARSRSCRRPPSPTSMSTTCSSRSASTSRSSATRRPAATSSPASGPFAVERGLVPAGGERTTVRIRLRQHRRPRHRVVPDARRTRRLRRRRRDRRRAGHGGADRARARRRPGSALLPTGNVVDEIDGHRVTLIDNGMPVVLLRADEFGVDGRRESPAELEARAGPDGRGRAHPARGRAR